MLADITKVLLEELAGVVPPLPLCCPKPSYIDSWIGFLYNFEITKIFIIIVSWGGGDGVLFDILCIAIVPVVIPVPSHR